MLTDTISPFAFKIEPSELIKGWDASIWIPDGSGRISTIPRGFKSLSRGGGDELTFDLNQFYGL